MAAKKTTTTELSPPSMGTPLSSTAGMFEPIGSAASMEFYMGYECFSEDILCGEGEAEAKDWPRYDPEKDPNREEKVQHPEDPFLPPMAELLAVQKHCDDLQAGSVKNIVQRAKKESLAKYDSLKTKVKDLGYNEAQLRRTLVYIRDEAPIVIHVKLDQGDRLQKMFNDTHYRSQFEVKISNGSYESNHSARKQWEDRLFDDHYAKAEPFQRPKYGVINICNDPVGEQRAHGYGDSYFITRGVRLRTTFTEKDSCNSDSSVACCEYYAHVLAKYSDSELRAVLKVSNLDSPFEKSSCISNYKEVQIHGEVAFAANIDTVVVNVRHKSDEPIKKLLDQFCTKNKCRWLFTDAYEEELQKRFEENKARLCEMIAAEKAATAEPEEKQ